MAPNIKVFLICISISFRTTGYTVPKASLTTAQYPPPPFPACHRFPHTLRTLHERFPAVQASLATLSVSFLKTCLSCEILFCCLEKGEWLVDLTSSVALWLRPFPQFESLSWPRLVVQDPLRKFVLSRFPLSCFSFKRD